MTTEVLNISLQFSPMCDRIDKLNRVEICHRPSTYGNLNRLLQSTAHPCMKCARGK